MVKFLTIPLCALLVFGEASAQVASGPVTATSRSGQFTVREISRTTTKAKSWESVKVPVAGAWGFLLNPGQGPSRSAQVQLEPALLAISCERLKEILLSELALNDQWRGRIDVIINSRMSENQEPFLGLMLGRDGWNYQLELPSRMKPELILRALVHVIFLEIANRTAGRESTQIPLWLVEGMLAHLQANNLPTLIFQPKSRMIGNRVKLEGLDSVRARLRENKALSFQELSWPEPELSGANFQLYQSCAQLFVHELLRFKDGRDCLRQMLLELPRFLNWQLAFLRAFHSHFDQLLDVEKWWGLTCVSFGGHDVAQTWTRAESWRKLQEMLDVPVQIHLAAERLPTAGEITLQEVILQWEPARELPTLQKTVAQLAILRLRIAPELASLVDNYRSTLEKYLRDHQSARRRLWNKINSTNFAALKKSVCQQLTGLDEQRAGLRAKMVSSRHEAELRALEISAAPPAPGSPKKP